MASAFHHERHFAMLGALAAGLAIAGPRAGSGIALEFALFGALHAAVVALSVAAGSGLPWIRRLAFVAVSALLAWSTVRLTMLGGQAAGGLGGSAGAFLILAAGSALGALAYGLSIRALLANVRWGGADARWLGAAMVGCAAAAAGGFGLARLLHSAALSWLVVPWWLAFSGSLWLADADPLRRQRRVA